MECYQWSQALGERKGYSPYIKWKEIAKHKNHLYTTCTQASFKCYKLVGRVSEGGEGGGRKGRGRGKRMNGMEEEISNITR